jgi:hypothetical protein
MTLVFSGDRQQQHNLALLATLRSSLVHCGAWRRLVYHGSVFSRIGSAKLEPFVFHSETR